MILQGSLLQFDLSTWQHLPPHSKFLGGSHGSMVYLNQIPYCWWEKSCTTLDGWNPINSGINHLSTGAGFLPSTVGPWFMMVYGHPKSINNGPMDIIWTKTTCFLAKKTCFLQPKSQGFKAPLADWLRLWRIWSAYMTWLLPEQLSFLGVARAWGLITKIARGLWQKKDGSRRYFLCKRNDIRGMVISIICISYTDPFLLFLGSRLFVIFC